MASLLQSDVMKEDSQPDLSRLVRARAISLGATAAGVVRFSSLRGNAAADRLDSSWPSGSGALVVLTLTHPESSPELDYWGVEGGTEGNRTMGEMLRQMSRWLHNEHGLDSRPLPYQVNPSGVVLKDAAVMAGLGVMGANNLLITPSLGPRVRIRALALTASLETTPATGFQPCDGCARPCLQACPQRAFEGGRYDRERCTRQMSLDESRRSVRVIDGPSGPQPRAVISYCRACELACVVGG